MENKYPDIIQINSIQNVLKIKSEMIRNLVKLFALFNKGFITIYYLFFHENM